MYALTCFRAAMLRRDLSCVWKSLGDVLTLSYMLPADIRYLLLLQLFCILWSMFLKHSFDEAKISLSTNGIFHRNFRVFN